MMMVSIPKKTPKIISASMDSTKNRPASTAFRNRRSWIVLNKYSV